LSSSRGVHLIPRPAQHHARRGPGGLPLQGLRNLTFGFEQDHPAHERVAAEHQGADGVPRADGTEPARIVVTLVRAGSARHREPLDLGGHQRSQRTPKNRRSCGIHRTTSDGEAARTRVQVLPPGCREPSGLLPTRRWSPKTSLTIGSRWNQRRNRISGPSSAAVPLACHSLRS
jgi:hypothetical protein